MAVPIPSAIPYNLFMEITCYRDAPYAQENLALRAATYNLAHTLLSRTPGGNLFVPLRGLQYLCIIDHEEFVFIDGMRKCWVDIAWRNFQPSRRTALDEPVAYEAVYYRTDGTTLMPRLLAELPLALCALANKKQLPSLTRIIKFPMPAKT